MVKSLDDLVFVFFHSLSNGFNLLLQAELNFIDNSSFILKYLYELFEPLFTASTMLGIALTFFDFTYERISF